MVCGSREKRSAGLLRGFCEWNADFVFVGARLRFDRKRNRGFRQLRRAVINRRSFVPQCFAGGRFLQLGDGANIARMQFRNFGELLSLDDQRVLEAFRVERLKFNRVASFFNTPLFTLK